jgi:hypothetical protein
VNLWNTLHIDERERLTLIVGQAEHYVARFPRNLALRDYAAIVTGHASLFDQGTPIDWQHMKTLTDCGSELAKRARSAEQNRYRRRRLRLK